jgi:hydrogenase maturation factor
MCIARVGQVLGSTGGKATVEFFDGRSLANVDVSMVGAKKGAYVEVFGNLALSELTAADARSRKKAWIEVQRAVVLARAEARRR